ncbi:unnamed protein product, partial [Coregonus sp. 'balchen']
ETPIPGSYHIRDFIEEAGLNPVCRMVRGETPRFRCIRGTCCYWEPDSTQEALQRQASYSFKNCPWPNNYTLGIRDKREGPAPEHYNMRTGPTKGVTCCFRSTVPRLHSVRSRTAEPGTYEPSWQM